MPFKKTYLLTILLCLLMAISYGQVNLTSSHNLHFYINDKEIPIGKSELSITIDSNKIIAKKEFGKFIFPLIDENKSYYLTLKVNNKSFKAGPYQAWQLNNGSTVTFGLLSKINRLLSVAEYNGMTEKDENWSVFAERFFICNEAYTIDIPEFKKIKKLEYLIVNPKQKGDGSYFLTQKVTKFKK